MKKQGFTLIELLVVIAIIAILAAILFPVFAQAREKARAISCVSNVKQMELGFMQYIQDYDENFPYWSWGASYYAGSVKPNDLTTVWYNAIYPYVKSNGVYACPDSNDHSKLSENHSWGWEQASYSNATQFANLTGINSALYTAEVDYGMSEDIENGTLASSAGTSPTSQAALDRVAQTLLVADCNTGLTKAIGGDEIARLKADTARTLPDHNFILSRVAVPNVPSGAWSNTAICGACQMDVGNNASTGANISAYDSQARHSKGDNIGFADGHVKFMQDRQINWDLVGGTQQ